MPKHTKTSEFLMVSQRFWMVLQTIDALVLFDGLYSFFWLCGVFGG